MQLGKKGITEDFIKEIKKNIRSKYTVKVRILKSFLAQKSRFEVAEILKKELPIYKCTLVGNVVRISR